MRHWLGLGWLTGPIFGKELRVSSRRRRNYVLRFVYLVLLLVFISVVWCNLDLSARSPAAMRYRMAQAGTQVITMIVVFQFVALPLLAVAMLSTSISEEISHRTLGGLMSTPITSAQIVWGKLLSRVFQLMLVAGISVPILAFLRMFGGVPWLFILSSLCVTLTMVLFAGALSLFFSIGRRQAHGVILRTLFVLILLFGILPGIFILMRQFRAYGFIDTGFPQWVLNSLGGFVTWLSPFSQMYYLVDGVLSPRAGSGRGAVFGWIGWAANCLMMLWLTGGLLALSIRKVRRVALSQAVGQLDQTADGRWRLFKQQAETPSEVSAIRRVRGACVVWKELRSPLIQGGKKMAWIGFGAAAVVQAAMYVMYSQQSLLKESYTHMLCVSLFLVIGLLGSIFQSATTITSEKETQSWPILLSTPLSDWQILLGKAFGTFRRCLPVWIFLLIHMVLFTALGTIHPAAMPIMAGIIIWVVVFLSGSGLYFSVQCKKTSSAVICNLALILLIWGILPGVAWVLCLFGPYQSLLNSVSFANPLVQAFIVMESLAGQEGVQRSLADIQFSGIGPPWAFWTALRLYGGAYLCVGLALMVMAKRRLRKRVF
ncbi:MAG: ABC transporter permease subunit [Phycisphaeraceae bacterium]|nr:ABC transporter permease subunit [Phycisphaeraceae bacterium]